MILPDAVSSAAPTLNLEYGDIEPSRALAAARTNLRESIFILSTADGRRWTQIKTFVIVEQIYIYLRPSAFICGSNLSVNFREIFDQRPAGLFHAFGGFQHFRVR